ncbi:hypothetical protein EDD29_0137 [Actinocorallia herbida]|uniref:Uncharacterized protein n=1 Tax=Actinocorallia herbida TaxID=58109 RepID=A0A3N1CMV6_9ACTN|nr:hypothetical protein [Actinocorallia herbida]ROO82656.1 hypothetical protein EDD29_0137 [Actinocorallia herbida]
MTGRIKIRRAVALELLEVAGSEPVDGFVFEAVQKGEGRRWNRTDLLVIRREVDGLLFASSFSVGLTENQPDDYWGSASWDYEGGQEHAEFHPVRKVEVITYAYRAVR